MHRAKTFDERVDDFRNVITFLTIINIKQHFKTLEDYFKSTDNKKAYHLHIDDKKVVRRLSHTKRESLLRKLLEATKGDFTYHKHCHRTYAGGRFKLNSWFDIPETRLRELFADASNFNTATCKLLTKQQHRWIDKHVFYNGKEEEKDTTMTKADKEKLKEECEKCLHGMPYDYLVKSIEKEEKSKLRTLQTRIRKMTQKAMVELTHENEMLKAENEALKAKVQHLEELKDINSDIPEDDDDDIDYEKPNEELDEAEKLAAGCSKPTNVFVAPPELAEKKVVETPVDDIPTPTSEEVTKLEKQINRLQEFVNKLYISVNEARQIASFFGKSPDLKEARGGWCVEDAHKHKGQRNTIFGYFKHELDNHQLVTDDAAKFFKGRA